jgi:DNA-binding protein
MGERGCGGDRNRGRQDGRPRDDRGSPRGRVDEWRDREAGGDSRGRDDRGFRGPPRQFTPRMERRGNEFHVFVSMVEIFADDIIRKEYVGPALDMLNAGIDCIVFKAKGQAINVAVRAALLLEAVMGVMQKHVSISSEPARPFNDRQGKDGSQKHDRLISAMVISMSRF